MLIIKIKEIRALSDNDLRSKINDLVLELAIEKRKVAATGVSSKVVKIREIKRTMARMNTVLNERGAKNR
ncbi:MAG: 50S ribosomal protein L29 [Candidatus Marsarchaeota archaeon]|nr:50S ribosomal protein L29 [Candidatus Marsarchaeota archaeon]MCL5434287.1 50S ribosomal protein L29 [Candidatus Marsarchaeota archaeon]MCW6160763.1 50S ribosomal protein L29 [Candidatus Micrarchaeales archaeon]